MLLLPMGKTMKIKPVLSICVCACLDMKKFSSFLNIKQRVVKWKGLQVWCLRSVKWVTTETKVSERGTQTNTNIPTGWEQASLGNENGSGGRLMAGDGETGLEVGAFMHNGPWEAPFSPVAGPFTGSSSPALKRTPHASPLPCQSTFLSHHSPTAVSGWRCVIIWTHLRPPACEEFGFVRVVVVARSHLVSNMLHVSYLMVWLLTSAG